MRNARTVGAAVVALALVVGVGVWSLQSRPRVVFLGDSITVVSGDQIKAALDSDYRADYHAVLGVQAGQMLDAAHTAASTDPDQVVIELGTNDVLHGASLDAAAADLRSIVADFPQARCIHLVNIDTHVTADGHQLGARPGLLNIAISRIVAGDPRVDLVDWNRVTSEDIAAHPPAGTLTGDTVHPTPAGRVVLAHQIRAALDRCNAVRP